MKDFIKWLGVNDKIAKLIVWIFIILVMLIIVNAALASIGFPHYQITYDNLKQIKVNKILQYIGNWIFSLLNFYAIVLLIFRVKEAKKLFKYGILYLVLNMIVTLLFNEVITQIFIVAFFLVFAFLYSGKNYKYILYAFISIAIDTLCQGLTYLYKAKFIDFHTLSEITKGLLFSDYFIIMGIIILVKEIYLKKRSEKMTKSWLWIGEFKKEGNFAKKLAKKAAKLVK